MNHVYVVLTYRFFDVLNNKYIIVRMKNPNGKQNLRPHANNNSFDMRRSLTSKVAIRQHQAVSIENDAVEIVETRGR